jgi:HAAS domain-containing protein
MTIPADSHQKIDGYLKVLRKRLRGLSDQDASDVVKEIRSHILDKAALEGEVTPSSVASALANLGSPEELASQYVTDNLMARARVSGSPWLVLQSLFRWASLSVVGLCTLMFSVLSYFLAGSFALCALLKPVHPSTAGLWLLPTRGMPIRLACGSGSVPRPHLAGNSWDGGSYRSDWFSLWDSFCSPSILDSGTFANSGTRCEAIDLLEGAR